MTEQEWTAERIAALFAAHSVRPLRHVLFCEYRGVAYGCAIAVIGLACGAFTRAEARTLWGYELVDRLAAHGIGSLEAVGVMHGWDDDERAARVVGDIDDPEESVGIGYRLGQAVAALVFGATA